MGGPGRGLFRDVSPDTGHDSVVSPATRHRLVLAGSTFTRWRSRTVLGVDDVCGSPSGDRRVLKEDDTSREVCWSYDVVGSPFRFGSKREGGL